MALERARAEETPLPVPDMSSPSSSLANFSFIRSKSAPGSSTGSVSSRNSWNRRDLICRASIIYWPWRSPEGGPDSRVILAGTGGRSLRRPEIAREPWLLDSIRFCSGGTAVASSSSSAIPPLTLPPRGDDGCDDDGEDDEDENEGLGDTARRLLDRSLSRLWPRRRNPPTITRSCHGWNRARAPAPAREQGRGVVRAS